MANCQAGMFLAYVSPLGRALVDKGLYLPESWTSDKDRCEVPPGLPVQDASHRRGSLGMSPSFREGLAALGMWYVLQHPSGFTGGRRSGPYKRCRSGAGQAKWSLGSGTLTAGRRIAESMIESLTWAGDQRSPEPATGGKRCPGSRGRRSTGWCGKCWAPGWPTTIQRVNRATLEMLRQAGYQENEILGKPLVLQRRFAIKGS